MQPFEEGLVALIPRLRRFAHGLTNSTADADDLTQTAIERALKARAQWEPGTRLDAWLYRIARNCWIDTARARGRKAKIEAPAEEGDQIGYDPRAATDAKIDLGRATAAMAKLPDEQRVVVTLILIEGFGYREAANILELPIGTVSSRLVRGRTALLAMLGEG